MVTSGMKSKSEKQKEWLEIRGEWLQSLNQFLMLLNKLPQNKIAIHMILWLTRWFSAALSWTFVSVLS